MKSCKNCNLEFFIDADDFDFYAKMSVPAPKFCPECRFKRRLAWRNGRILFRRRDDATGKEIFSGFPPNIGATVYDHEYWKSDAWDPFSYGRDYDFSRGFFEQYRELLYSVPWPSKSVQQMVNSDYCDQAGYLKNCYLCFDGDRMEDSAYTIQCDDSKFCFDCNLSVKNELCYECVGVNGSYRTLYSQNCESCTDVWFSKNCAGCTDCFGCINFRDKTNYFFNEKYSKEEYKHKVAEYQLHTQSGIRRAQKETQDFFLKFPVKNFHGFRAIDSSGDYLRNTKNVRDSYFMDDAKDCRFCYRVQYDSHDCYDHSVWGGVSSLMYECMTCGDHNERMKFCFESWPGCRELEYCHFLRSSSNCFGCVSLKKAQYCILNKQYTKEKYEDLVRKIKTKMIEGGEYGEFFPTSMSPFTYNETVRQDIWPLSKEEAIAQGHQWREPDQREFRISVDYLGVQQLSDEQILKEVIGCSFCKKAYRIIESELQYLRRMNLPLPDACVSCRFSRRYAMINKPRFYDRKCTKCGVEFKTSYAPDRPEIVYCEQCYQNEIL